MTEIKEIYKSILSAALDDKNIHIELNDHTINNKGYVSLYLEKGNYYISIEYDVQFEKIKYY